MAFSQSHLYGTYQLRNLALSEYVAHSRIVNFRHLGVVLRRLSRYSLYRVEHLLCTRNVDTHNSPLLHLRKRSLHRTLQAATVLIVHY